ncbi:hypothetical protein ACFV8T_16280 [Streptomyces sp. NPDC059832]|uniref:hypothetical protein n=1 Tax=unclassified Streptomyces TaxID=2593676 RepID=UPI00364E8B9E
MGPFGGTTSIIGRFLLNRTGSITAVIAYAVFRVALTLGCMLLLLKRPNHDEQAAEPVAMSHTAVAAV